MSIIRFSTDEVFETDSQEYEVLYNAAKAVEIPGAILEIGTRRGGSAKLIMDALVENGQNKCEVNGKIIDRPFFCVDPYGNIEIECTNLNMSVHYPGTQISGDPSSKEITAPHRFDYTNQMRNRVIPSLYYYAYQQGFDFRFFQLTDAEYVLRYNKGVPIYNEEQIIIKDYAFVFLDGPHDNDNIEFELQFFADRCIPGSVIVTDDTWMYSHDKIVEGYLFKNGWKTLERKNIKASYIKVE